MDVVGSEIGQKMRSAIKAKLTELGCYVDDELPDYVMVMVANKRTRSQMEDDLQLFLGDNTQLFVNWLHQVLKKLQEVTVTAPLKTTEIENEKKDIPPVPKEKKSKVKKDKTKRKSDSTKKSKKKDKEKAKKLEKKLHKNKKKSKHHESIRPNIPPLLMNMEKDSEPSITDVFAGQILKNHGILLDTPKVDTPQDEKPPQDVKRSIMPIIDLETITSQSETEPASKTSVTSIGAAPEEEQIKEINEIEAKIQGLKQKLAEQLDSMSEDEDFLNIRTEAEELMNDFADDVLQEISQPPPTTVTVPLISPPIIVDPETIEIQETPKDPIETLPQIELKLPKRPVRERLGAREELKKVETRETKLDSKEKQSELKEKDKFKEKRHKSQERFTPDREPDFWPKSRSAKSRLGDLVDAHRKSSLSDDSEKSETVHKRITSKVSVLESRSPRVTCASVVRVRPRPRVAAPASSLLMRAVADAHKSLCNVLPKLEPDQSKIKRALVLPMRRCVDTQKIVIQVPSGDDDMQADAISLDMDSDIDKSPKNQIDERVQFKSSPIIKKFTNTEYVPSFSRDRLATRKDDTLVVETINIHNPTIDKDKSTQFIVTMDGFNPNAFLAKKLMTEGLLNDDDILESKPKEANDTQKNTESNAKENKQGNSEVVTEETNNSLVDEHKEVETLVESIDDTSEIETIKKKAVEKKRLSNTSDESDTQVIINKDRKSEILEEESPPAKKKRVSPIVFDVSKKEEKIMEKERVRERTNSVNSDNHVTVATSTSSHKYDSVPSLSQAERKTVWCRAFPACRFGAACAFIHPRCRFLASCTRRGCVYSHQPGPTEPAPVVASHVVPAANYKSISATPLPAICKFYPSCVNPTCHFYHPKPCRYGNACVNKIECNFYHSDVQKYKYPA